MEIGVQQAIVESQEDDLLLDVKQKVSARLVMEGFCDTVQADAVADAVYEELLSNWGGQQVYIKKLYWGRGSLSGRDSEMYEKFNGNNHHELAKEYGITLQRVYEIIKIVHKGEIDRRQSKLFPDGESS